MRKWSPEVIKAAIEGFERQKELIDEKIASLRLALNGEVPDVPERTSKRKLSPEGKEAIREGIKRYWKSRRSLS